MNRMLFSIAVLAVTTTGCAGAAFMGFAPGAYGFYTDVSGTTPIHVEGSLPAGKAWKVGEACQTSVLGLMTTGSATIGEAAKAGGITRINRVDYKFSNIVNVFAKYCTVVVGD